MYLSPELNVKKLYELYLEKYEKDMFDIYGLKDKKHLFRPKVTYDFYFRYFKANFNISFGSPRSDTCKTCDEYENKLKLPLPDEELNQIKTSKQLHVSRAQVFFDALKEKTEEAKNNPEVEVLCFDHQQNAPLPKVPSGDAFYLRQLWVFNFCIYSAKTGISHFYMYDETTGKKTPNETISFLDHYLKNIMSKDVKTLYIFSDNCAAQNKNGSLVQYLFTLAQTKQFQSILHRYPEPGHSFLPCDRSFGVVEKALRKMERIFTPQEYMTHYGKCSRNFEVVPVEQNMIFDFVNYLKPNFKKTVINQHRQKFAISKYKLILYEANSGIQCSESCNVPIYSTFNIQCSTLDTNTAPNQLYKEKLPLKKVKYDNVMVLANQYVPKNDLSYYEKLTFAQGNTGSDVEMTNDEETIE
ncbi:uncharacterized protein LOC130897743 [Diorhabda carinulata]|uniref:uncharacterized protein LOC130897743 n=1 Tax=Diorhabda carinulata TaxID=1163345 RepID=UPI0025A05004|nr:uncharacterized protein LOC130897743 [Diorhabda carinulata]